MPAALATLVFALGIRGLLFLDRDRESRVSPGLWVAVAWVFIASSRMVSEWLYPGASKLSPDAYLDGSPMDRLILAGLLAAGVMVLLSRRQRVAATLRANTPLLLFFLYCGVSVLWSDYPDVALKRLIKVVGNFVMVLVVLTDPDPIAALKLFLRRLGFLLIPLSVLLIKYYPEYGRSYDPWTWVQFYGGVMIGKNGLGQVCLVFGVASFWRLFETLRSEGTKRTGSLIAHGLVLLMVAWLLTLANSATSLACLLIGIGLIVATGIPGRVLQPGTMHSMVATVLLLVLFGLFFESGTGMVEALGRDSTLTGRTRLWADVLRIPVDPLIGTGFESFWLGERVEKLWLTYWWRPNQAHNGYLEIFLNLGWIGILLFAGVAVWGYRQIVAGFYRNPEVARIRLAFFVVAAVYNLTEAAFKGMHVVGIVCLLAVTVVPEPRHLEHQ